MWALHSVDVSNPQMDTVKWLKARLQHLVEQCHELVKFGTALGQREAFVTLCDLLIMFAKQLNNIGTFNHMHSNLSCDVHVAHISHRPTGSIGICARC